ncbi:MAG: pentapeptide repeat-containing protein [Planctomycetota bacterium]|jgi:hypothetical protein
MTTKTQLRRRWKDESFVEGLSLPLGGPFDAGLLSHQDLRGVPKLGLDGPLGYFTIVGSECEGIDLSYGDGALIVSSSTVAGITCHEFRFDRASRFSKASVEKSDFLKARLRLDATDTVFDTCCFAETTFVGGMNEFGFKRCTFRNCSFAGARWERTFIRACRFDHCDFSQTQIIDSVVAGFKHQACSNFTESMFFECQVSGVDEIA